MEAARKRAEAETRAAEAAEKLQKEREILECKRQRKEKMKEWTNLLEKLKQEEEERLCILAEPLRHYLTKYVFPTLTEALIEVAKLRPEDPIDFLVSISSFVIFYTAFVLFSEKHSLIILIYYTHGPYRKEMIVKYSFPSHMLPLTIHR
ncbi:Putative adenylate kinase 7 [Camponotus floridanus]|uniref:Putative adenylate kinase 7 n=1 Tax=Camponotus floridanus TaxID=104421 RepID=E2AP08_CAMFO|nr:Putative adenylate kinase 7 [Camponotus floridanus]